ncbi:protein phosphatase 2C [Pelomyxa schiedti]|nr:protein phosphatase 2C [Pelomyxa schiedti]
MELDSQESYPREDNRAAGGEASNVPPVAQPGVRIVLQSTGATSFPGEAELGIPARRAKIQSISVGGNLISEIPPYVGALPALSDLDVSHNRISYFPADTVVARAATLRHLYISGNNIREIPRDAVSALVNLMTLRSALNPLGEGTGGFPTHLFALPSILTLDLSRTGLKGDCGLIELHRPTFPASAMTGAVVSAPKPATNEPNINAPTTQTSVPTPSPQTTPTCDVVGTCHLNGLILDHNKLRSLPDNIGKIHELHTLQASFNHLRSIPDSLCSLTKLDTLILSENRLSTLPDDLPLLPYLTTLDISNNPITAFPPRWFTNGNGGPRNNTWLSLMELSAHDMLLEELPVNFFSHLPCLSTCNLSRNNLVNLPDFTHATSLVCLYVSNNQLTSFPASFTSLIRLEHLDISCNSIVHCPSLATLTRLCNFSAGYNPFMETPDLPPGLAELNLSGCILTKPPTGSFLSLRKLYLSLNEFTRIPAELVSSTQLGTVDVSFNKLDSLPIFHADYVNANRNSETIQRTVPLPSNKIAPPCVNMHVGIAETLGRRLSMEDVICYQGQISPGADFIGLFDGHGGKEVADFVSSVLPGYFKGVLPANEEEVCKTGYQQTQVKCREYLGEDADEKQIGSTSLTALVWRDHIFMANAGDSRAILWRKDHAIRLSRDHKPLDPEEYKRIRQLGGYVTEVGRVNGIIAVSRSFGDFFVHPLLDPEPYFTTTQFSEEDRFLLLACDGVWDVLTDEKAGTIVNLALDAYDDDPEAAAYVLRDAAYLNGSTDNISVAVCVLKKYCIAKQMEKHKLPRTKHVKHNSQPSPHFPLGQAGVLVALRHSQSTMRLKMLTKTKSPLALRPATSTGDSGSENPGDTKKDNTNHCQLPSGSTTPPPANQTTGTQLLTQEASTQPAPTDPGSVASLNNTPSTIITPTKETAD